MATLSDCLLGHDDLLWFQIVFFFMTTGRELTIEDSSIRQLEELFDTFRCRRKRHSSELELLAKVLFFAMEVTNTSQAEEWALEAFSTPAGCRLTRPNSKTSWHGLVC